MNIEDLRKICLSYPGVKESFPFDDKVLVFKLIDKIFALVSLDNPEWVLLKCEPERALQLREAYDEVQPAWHMNKKHWNQVRITALPEATVYEQIDHSYTLIYNKLTRRDKAKVKTKAM